MCIFSAQRPSPSSPNLQADNPKGAGEGLDVTACSASSLLEGMTFDDLKSLWKKATITLATKYREETIGDEQQPYKEDSLFYMSNLFSILCDGQFDESYSRFHKIFDVKIPER